MPLEKQMKGIFHLSCILSEGKDFIGFRSAGLLERRKQVLANALLLASNNLQENSL